MATLVLVQDILPRAAAWGPVVSRGGHTLCILQWLAGLERLGHEVLFIDFAGKRSPQELAVCREYFDRIVRAWWHPSHAALLTDDGTESLSGLTISQVRTVAARSDALLTLAISGKREPAEVLAGIRPRVLVDHDPGYTHIWAQLHGAPEEVFGSHDFYFTVGGNVGKPRCKLPSFGIDWMATWNPVVLEWWPSNRPVGHNVFTTVADWWGQQYLEFDGKILGPKREEFLKFLDLPQCAGESIELVLDIPPADRDLEKLAAHGWQVRSPAIVALPEAYIDWVVGSAGEFSCAKGVYVGTQCGWFSDRSACFLAAGRPAILQDTGFSDLLPTGEGLFAVRNVEEAAAALRKIRSDYEHHARVARTIAQEFFAAERVLRPLLERVGIHNPR